MKNLPSCILGGLMIFLFFGVFLLLVHLSNVPISAGIQKAQNQCHSSEIDIYRLRYRDP